MNTTPEYIPGTCNIGPAEIKMRKKSALFSTVLGIALIVLLLLLHASKMWRLVLFIPATSVAIGLQQWYYKFCVAFGLKGVFNFGDIGKTYSAEQQEYFKKDRAKAWRMISTGIALGILITVLFYILPL